MSQTPFFAERSAAATTVAIIEPRARALLGERPLVTLVDANDPDMCLSVKLVRAGAAFIGIVDDHAAFLDRVRMGLKPAFVVHHEGQTPTITGELDVRILDKHDAAALLLAEQPFGRARAVIIEVVPRSLAIVEEGAAIGAVPRT